jgi:hypothetical protein
VNVTDVLARVMQLQVQAGATGTVTRPSGGADFAALLNSARTAGTPGQQVGLPGALTSMATTGSALSPTLLPSLLPANLRAAAVADPADPSATDGDAAPAVRKSCGCESH